MEYFFVTVARLAGAVPALLFWMGVIIFGVVMLGRGGGRAERFMIGGGGVEVLTYLLRVTLGIVPLWLRNGGSSAGSADSIATALGIIVDVIGAAGIGLLIYAFWLKFHERKIQANATIELERGPHDAVPQ